MDIQAVIDDISAFADDDEELIVEPTGAVLFRRGGEEIECCVTEDPERGLLVQIDNEQLTYKRFISHKLGRLDVLAERLLAKRLGLQVFVNGPAVAESVTLGSDQGSALSLLDRECQQTSPFSARVIFVTGDAGHGKTALLREYQQQQARSFLEGKSSFLFWHVDLQGRQLLRLSEALMGDLGELRVQGIFYPSLIRLLRNKSLVLAIDGFDELAAEQGDTDAFGALAQLVQALGENGVVVAASRRTFFDTEDYLARSGMLRRAVASDCEFDQIRLLDWRRQEALEYLQAVEIDQQRFAHPQATYIELLTELGGDESHPIIARPFLLAQSARILLRYGISSSEFVQGMEDPMESVAAVVSAFIEREVSEKWKAPETGEPYLTNIQHLELLREVAEEMWVMQKDRLDVETIELIAVGLLDTWGVGQSRKRQVVEMVRMHVLLTIPSDGAASMRSFDHPEFRNYFLASAVRAYVEQAMEKGESDRLGRLLSIGQLPDSVAHYMASLIDRTESRTRCLVDVLCQMVKSEWKPTFLQSNIGTLIPILLESVEFSQPVTVDAKVVYSSLAFDRSNLSNVRFAHGFLNRITVADARWSNVEFTECEADEVRLDRRSTYSDVTFRDCRIDCVVISEDGEDMRREYAPERIVDALSSLGIRVIREEQLVVVPETVPSQTEMLVRKFLRLFLRSTGISEDILKLKFRRDLGTLRKKVIPLMLDHKLLREELWRGGGRQKIWILTHRVDDVLRGIEGEGNDDVVRFWDKVRSAG